MKMLPPPHPGETIEEDYPTPLGMSANQLVEALGVGATRMNEIVRGRRGVTADTALRLARYFNTSAEFWLNPQTFYDLRMAQAKAGRQISRLVKPREEQPDASSSPS
jgi:antitoxin HigA-1